MDQLHNQEPNSRMDLYGLPSVCALSLPLLSTGSTSQFLLCWCWTMLSLQMMDQGLLCSVAMVAGLTPMALFLSTGFLMQLQHYSRCKDLPTLTRVTCFPSMGSHMPLQGPGTLEGLMAKGTVGISSLDIRHLMASAFTAITSDHHDTDK